MTSGNFYQRARTAIATMLGEDVNPELVTVSVPGSSGSRVSIFRHPRTGSMYAVKCAFSPRVSMWKEVSRRQSVVPYLDRHLPAVLWCGVVADTEVLVSRCDGLFTLHQSVLLGDVPHSNLHYVWHSVLSSLTGMWMETRFPFIKDSCPRHYSSRLERIERAIRGESIRDVPLGDCFDLPVVVNGVEYPSLSKSFSVLKEMGEPQFGITCQGDPQPSNIVIGDDVDWYFVDWEWAGPHQDWRGMVSHLKGWWHSRCLLLKNQPAIRVASGRLVLEYDASLPDHLKPFSDSASNLAFVEANATGQDLLDINRYLAVLYFGELRFLKGWGRPSFAVPLLSQAVITAHLLGRNSDLNPFQFPI